MQKTRIANTEHKWKQEYANHIRAYTRKRFNQKKLTFKYLYLDIRKVANCKYTNRRNQFLGCPLIKKEDEAYLY